MSSHVPARVLDLGVVTLGDQGFGPWGSSGSDGSAAGLNRERGGFVTGADVTLPEVGPAACYEIGLVGGFTSSRLDLPSRASPGTIETDWGALYGASGQLRDPGGWYLLQQRRSHQSGGRVSRLLFSS